MRLELLTGKRYGRLLLLDRLANGDYACACDCGKFTIVHRGNVTRGNTRSCGCLKLELLRRRRAKSNSRELAIGRYYRRNAKVRNLAWELDQTRLECLLHGACYYCGKKPALGVDRLDNSRGYILGNVTSCCKRCNQAKNDMTYVEFYDWVASVHKYWLCE